MSGGLNGSALFRRNNTIHIPLPPSAWVEIDGGCRCDHCKAIGAVIAFWDTLSLAENPKKSMGNDVTWMVHAPELQPDYREKVLAEERRVEERERDAALKAYGSKGKV